MMLNIMPGYRRRRRFVRRRFGRKRRGGFMSRRFSVSQIARTAYRGYKYLRGLVNVERYKFDVANTATPDTSGVVVALSNVAQGDGDSDRTGFSILAKSLWHRLTFSINASASTTWIRYVVFMDTQQIGDTAPGVTDVLDAATIQSPLNNTSVGRFTILRDKVIVLDNVGQKNSFLRAFIRMQHHIRFNGSAATDVQKGALYMILLSSEATNTPSVSYYSRLSYHDN